MDTTIQISKDLLQKLKSLKIQEKETYEDLIWDLLEDRMELSEETKRNIAKSEEDIKKGRVHKWEDVKKELKINV
jgi:predicted CopG family antitoxin